MRRFIKWVVRLFLFLLTLLVIAYFLVPPLTETLFDTQAIRSKLKTEMLPSDQPRTVHLEKSEKRVFRAQHLDTYLGTAFWTALGLPRLAYNYLNLEPEHKRIDAESIGIFVDPAKNESTEILKSIAELGVRSIGQRIYVDDTFLNSDAYRKHLELAKRLHELGYDLLLVLAQRYESFQGDLPGRMSRVIRDFAPYVDDYQIGEAVNRSKWGVPDKDDYIAFVDAAFDAIRAHDPTAKTLGPSVIDFEWFYTLYFDHLADNRFDIANTLLYVDRVRQPENEQHGFDTDAKIRLFKAIRADKPLWITEVNWPIKGMGRFKPTSEKEAVSEREYRNYMLRYLIIALGSGYVDRVYWWQLYARGYGLIDHLEGRKRDAFQALANLQRLLSGSEVLNHTVHNGLYDYRFEKKGTAFHLLWTKDETRASLPSRKMSCSDLLDGKKAKEIGPLPVLCKELSP